MDMSSVIVLNPLTAITRVKEINDIITALNKEKQELIKDLVIQGFAKDVVAIGDKMFTVTVEDRLQEDGKMGGFIYMERYALKFYERKSK